MLVIISGPSAAGKTTLANLLLQRGFFTSMLKSATTRPPRGPNDNEYTFVTREEFDCLDLAERVEYDGNLYGLPTREVKRALSYGIHVVVAEPNGMKQIVKNFSDSSNIITIFLDSPDDHLLRRLEERGSRVKERMARLDYDRQESHLYDRVIMNLDGKLEDTAEEIAHYVTERREKHAVR